MRYILAAAIAAASAPTSAAVIYSNNFDAENAGLTAGNYNSFRGLTVSNGTVDLVRSGDFGIACAGGTGACVDLDGSTSDGGRLTTDFFAYAAGDRVSFRFLFGGNQRGSGLDAFRAAFRFSTPGGTGRFGYQSTVFGPQDLGARSNIASLTVDVFNIPSNFPLTDLALVFEAQNSGSIAFSVEDTGSDNFGVTIDDIVVERIGVPEPATWAMMIAGFGIAGAAARRRVRSAAALA